MPSLRFKAWTIGFVLLVLPAIIASAQRFQNVDSNDLMNSGKTGKEWLTYNLDYAETRYSRLKQLDTRNVGRLGLAWAFDIPVGGRQEATPLMANGTLYWIGIGGVTFAADARTGKEKWRYDPGGKIRESGAMRGVGIFENKIFLPSSDGKLIALNAETGTLVWSIQTTPYNEFYRISMAPRIINGKVIIGNGGGEVPVRGFISAYDANTGKLIWRFYTVPGNPANGFENDAMKKASETWSGEWYKMGGGGGPWDSIAYDPELNLVYFGTGNGGPWPEELRQSKGKDNLYIASVLALNADTGAYVWHYQFTPGDSWDYDATQQLTLADLRIDGRSRNVIMQANKNGFFYVLDRRNGQFISAQPFAQLNWASGIDPKTGRPQVNSEAHYGKKSVCIFPGANGAHAWSPMSFNPTLRLMYISIIDPSLQELSVDPNFVYNPTRSLNLGTGNNSGSCNLSSNPAESGGPRGGPPPEPGLTLPIIGPVRNLSQGQLADGWLIAWDPVTQKERWRVIGGGIRGGVLTTAGNLVFQSNGLGYLRAFSADKGEKLWEVPIPTQNGIGPPMTFMLDGKQYIVVPSNVSSSDVPPGRPRPPNLSRLYAFVLDGKTPMPAPAIPAR